MKTEHQEDLEDFEWESKKYTFFLSNEDATDILLLGIISRLVGVPEHHECIVHTTAVNAKRIFQVLDLPMALIFEEPVLGTCMWTLLL